MIQDTGMRPEEVFRIRIENINWTRRLIFNPSGKTRAARRHVPISERMLDLLMVRCAGKREGWLFPSPRAVGGHLTTVAKQFREARRKAGLPQRWCCIAPVIHLVRRRMKQLEISRW